MVRLTRQVCAVILLLLFPALGNAALPPCDPTMPSMRFIPKDYWQRVDPGWYVFVACRDSTTNLFQFYGGACRHGVCDQSSWARAVLDFGTAIGDDAKKAVFKASWEKIITEDCTAPPPENAAICEAYREKRDATQVALNATIPPPLPPAASAPPPITQKCVVTAAPSNSPDGKKPVYDFTPPATLKINGKRTTPGTVADCNLQQYKTSTTTYCSVPEGGLAVCKVGP